MAFLRSSHKNNKRQTQHIKFKKPSLKSKLTTILFGPTTLHLKHEVTLLFSLTLLTTASLVSLYRRSFGTIGDFQLILLSFLWLSRYLCVRILATCDSYLSISSNGGFFKTIKGCGSRFLTRYICAGQYFDVPSLDALVVGGSSYGSGGGRSGGGDGHHHHHYMTNKTYSSWLRDSFVHDWIVGPIAFVWGFISNLLQSKPSSSGSGGSGGRVKRDYGGRRRDVGTTSSSSIGVGSTSSLGGIISPNALLSPSSSNTNSSSSLTSSNTKAAAHKTSSALYNTIDKYLDYIPPAQMCIALIATGCILCGIFVTTRSSSLMMHQQQQMAFAAAGGFAGGASAAAGGGGGAANTRLQYNQALSGYQHHTPRGIGGGARDFAGGLEDGGPPSLWKVLFALTWVGTLSSLLVYGRVLLPFPDLAAGSNVLKAVRAEAKHHGGGGKLSKPKNQDHPWAEQYKSINLENRFRLHCKVIFLRIIENIILCSVIPQTEFACRVTGHCDSAGPVSWGGGVGGGYGGAGSYPSTIMVGSIRKHTTMFDFVIHDRGTSIIITLTVVLVSALLLLGQVTTLDRTYLAIMGYISGEWSNVSGGGSSSQRGKSKGGDVSGLSSTQRRYKKSDLGMPSSNSSDKNKNKNPFDLYLRASHEMYRNELGHVSTSNVICYAFYIHTVQLILVGIVIVMYHNLGYSYGALIVTFLASFVSLNGLVNIGMVDDVELGSIADEIATPVQQDISSSSSM